MPYVEPEEPEEETEQKEIETVDDIPLVACIFGPPKVGKSEFALTYPNPGIIDCDHGIEVMLKLNKGFRRRYPDVYDNRKEILERTRTFAVETDDKGLPKNAQAFFDIQAHANALMKDPWVKTVVLDSLTAFSAFMHLIGIYANDKGKRSNTLINARTGGVLLSVKQDFGAEMNGVEQILDKITTCGKNVIVTAHEREDTTDSGLVISVSPLVTGNKLRAKIARWFSDVWYLQSIEGGHRELIPIPNKKLKVVGSRLGLEKSITNPTYGKVLNALRD